MTTPTPRDPISVTTLDGMRWVRAAVTRTGRGLYAPEAMASCPQFVMATLAELAEHGIQGQDPLADAVAVMGALPVPLGHAEPGDAQGPPPLELTEQQLDALVDAGNGALSDYYHDRACACSEYPAACVTNPAYRRAAGYWDTDAFAVGLGAVLAVWEGMRSGDGATRSVDEDPIRYSLTVEALHASSGAVIETRPRTEWSGATEIGPPGDEQRLAATGLVGYRQDRGRLLHCLAHKPAPVSRYADFHTVSADDLPDGGICVHPRCGRDLLASWHESTPRPRPVPHDLPEVTTPDAIEYGIATDNEYGQRVLDPSPDLAASLERLARSQVMWPNSRLVQRTNGGEWAEVTP